MRNVADTVASRSPGRPRRGPLAGIRVADFCWMGVGSVATRLLADFGAEVIKIEDRTRIDTPRKLPHLQGRAGAQLRRGGDRRRPEPGRALQQLLPQQARRRPSTCARRRAAQLAERLIAESSVVSENFAPGVMERWGLTYERLEELSPEVIYARMSGYGHSGPHAEYRSYGPVVQAVSGLSYISGLPGREPSGWGLSYMDNQAAYYNSAALLMAIYRRNLTGQGTEIDVSAIEAGINLVGPVLLDVTVNGHTTRRPDFPTGNRLEWPQRGAARRLPGAGRRPLGRHRRVRRRRSGPVWSRRSAAPHGPHDPRFATQDGSLRAPGRARRPRRGVDP